MVPDQEKLLDEYCSLLMDWNSRVRLTGFETIDDIRKNLVFEPVNASRFFSLSDANHPLVDLGSGNGSPGMIFAILNPARQTFLIERRQKKMTFLLYVAGKLKLSNVHVLEDIGMIHPHIPGNRIEVWSKAVSWLDLSKACSPLLSTYSPICIRKFGDDLPLFTCSSTMVHGITFKDFPLSRKKFGEYDFYVSEAILSRTSGF